MVLTTVLSMMRYVGEIDDRDFVDRYFFEHFKIIFQTSQLFYNKFLNRFIGFG